MILTTARNRSALAARCFSLPQGRETSDGRRKASKEPALAATFPRFPGWKTEGRQMEDAFKTSKRGD